MNDNQKEKDQLWIVFVPMTVKTTHDDFPCFSQILNEFCAQY